MSWSELKRNLSDRWWRLDNLYWIEDEHGRAVKFKLRPIQKAFLMAMWFWNIILKARQLGFTTAIDIFILDSAIFNANQKCGIIAHTKDDAEEIFRTKIKFAYDRLPDPIKRQVTADTSRSQQLVFSNGSSIRVATSMRSGTLQYLHISEYGKICAKYPEKAREVKIGSLPACHEGSFVFIESTAEGVGGDYYDRCQAARQRQQDNVPLAKKQEKFHFFPWWMDPKYQVPPPPGWKPEPHIEQYFRELSITCGRTFSPAQQYWYQIEATSYGNEMPQEYPSTPDEAFLFSGRARFPAHEIKKARDECFKPKAIYTLHSNKRPEKSRETQPALELLLVWELPKPGQRYAIGSDVSEGLEQGDRSTIDVCDANGYQVAHWCGLVDPDLLGEMLNQLGRWYNNALMAVERNNHGLTTLSVLKRLRYPKLFIQTDIERRAGEKETKKIGWLSTARTKPLAVDHLAKLLREETHGIAHQDTVSEMQTYVIDEKGATNAQDGCFDDRVMSYAICQQMVQRIRIGQVDNSQVFKPVSKAGY